MVVSRKNDLKSDALFYIKLFCLDIVTSVSKELTDG